VQQQLAELAAVRAQLARMEAPREDSPGSFVARVREYRYAETLVDSIARQAEAARVDEAHDALPLQLLDSATIPEFPSSPRLPLWLLAGLAAGWVIAAATVLLRHRLALARLDEAYVQRVDFLRSLQKQRRG